MISYLIINFLSILTAFILGGLMFRIGYKTGFYRQEYNIEPSQAEKPAESQEITGKESKKPDSEPDWSQV